MTDDEHIPLTFEEAEGHLRRQIARCEDRATREALTLDRVVLYSRAGHHAEARQLVRELLRTPANPADEARYLLNLGQLQEQTEDFQDARDSYLRGLTLDAGEAGVRYLLNNNLGYTLNQLGEYEAAQAYCIKAIEIDPARHNAWKNLGASFEGQGRPAAAAGMYLKAAELHPRDPRALCHLVELVAQHPEVPAEVADFDQRLDHCRRRAEAANGNA
ncbi:MAG: tetratricopeptide repeat protein [Gammaproteobacteria bacterium]|nr:tetratricopeptide repeat protein [Gammaproteobacteria bacterium]